MNNLLKEYQTLYQMLESVQHHALNLGELATIKKLDDLMDDIYAKCLDLARVET